MQILRSHLLAKKWYKKPYTQRVSYQIFYLNRINQLSWSQARKWKISYLTFKMKLTIAAVLFAVLLCFASIQVGEGIKPVCDLNDWNYCKANCFRSGLSPDDCLTDPQCHCSRPPEWTNPINRLTLWICYFLFNYLIKI